MEITIAGGAVVDLATSDELRQHHSKIEQLIGEHPSGRIQRCVGTGVVGAGAGTVQAFGLVPDKPPAGYQWLVQYGLVWQKAANPLTAVANANAGLFRGRSPGANNNMAPTPIIEFAELVAPFTGINGSNGVPGFAQTSDKLQVHGGAQQLYVVLFGSGLGASGTIYQAVVEVLELPDTDEATMW